MDYTIKIKEFDIVIDLYDRDIVGKDTSGKIQSTMHKKEMPSRLDYSSFSRSYNDESTSRAFHDAMINAIEAMILAHAVAGINVTEESYAKGIRAAIVAAEIEYK